jgi:hypothetical protein
MPGIFESRPKVLPGRKGLLLELPQSYWGNTKEISLNWNLAFTIDSHRQRGRGSGGRIHLTQAGTAALNAAAPDGLARHPCFGMEDAKWQGRMASVG